MADRIAVTGATGFIGSHLLQRLLDAGYSVRALTRRSGVLPKRDAITPIIGDLEDPAALRSLLDGVAGVVHSAGLIRARTPEEFARVNAGGTRRLAAAVASVAPNARFILLSSLAAREPALSAYGASKHAAEEALSEPGMPARWVALRPPAVYGPGDRATLGLFRQLSRRVAMIPTAPDQRLSLIHVDDLTQAITTLLKLDSFDERVMEIHDGRQGGYGWPDLARAAAAPLHNTDASAAVPRLLHLPRGIVRFAAAANAMAAALAGKAPLLGAGKVAELYHPDWVCKANPLAEAGGWRPAILAERGFPSTLAWYKGHHWL